jgi:hypothetical protein
MTENNTPVLLRMLQKTVDDESVFDMHGIEEVENFKKQFREAWVPLFDNAAQAWLDAFDPENEAELKVVGPEMCHRYMPLSSCWLENYANAMLKTSRRPDLPGKHDREFLYVMLGVLMGSWQTYLALRSQRIDPARYRPDADRTRGIERGSAVAGRTGVRGSSVPGA